MMIVYQRFMKTFYRELHLKFRCHDFGKYSYLHRKWSSLDVPQKSLSNYHSKGQSYQAESEFSLSNDVFLFGDTDSFSLYFINTLYPDTDDEIISKLKLCQSSREVLDTIDQCESASTQQLVHAVLLLRGFQKFVEANNEATNSDFLKMFHDFETALKSSSFNKLINSIVQHASQMNLDELSSCLLYLHRFNVSKETVMELTNTFESILKNTEESEIGISSLARVCIVFKDFNNIWGFYSLHNLLPLLLRKLDSCSDVITFGKITICFQKMVPLLNSNVLQMYLEKCSMLLVKNNDVGKEISRVRTVLKSALFLCFKSWQGQYSRAERELLLSLCGCVKYLSCVEAAILYEVALSNQECGQLVDEIEKTVDEWVSQIQDDSKKLHFLSLFPKTKRSYKQKREMIQCLCDKPLLANELFSNLNNMYFLLKNVDDTRSREYSNAYWDRALEYFINFPALISVDKLLWICLRYLNYHSSKGYYYLMFEKRINAYLLNLFFNERNSILSPQDYVKIGLVIAFFQPSLSSFSEPVWNRLINNISCLNLLDNLNVSFIVKAAMKRVQKADKFSKILPNYMNVITALNNNSFQNLSIRNNFNLELLNSVLKAFLLREGIHSSPLSDLIRDRLRQITVEQMSSKSIRNCVTNLMNCNYVEPQLIDGMVTYCIREKDHVPAILFSYLLNYIFSVGYTSENCEEFVDCVKKITIRATDKLGGNGLIKTSLALCYYHDLPVELTDYIFNVDFLSKVDGEIERSKNRNLVKYIRQNLMELNQAVCLEYPERDIPWFHEKYCKEKSTLESRRKDIFFDDVLRKLGEIIPNKKAVMFNCISPYYHKIDFLIHTNRKGEPVDPDCCAPSNLRKIALLLSRQLCVSSHFRGKGKLELLIRQLELLDYQVIIINKKVWNSMYMSEPSAKENYLCSLIWPRS